MEASGLPQGVIAAIVIVLITALLGIFISRVSRKPEAKSGPGEAEAEPTRSPAKQGGRKPTNRSAASKAAAAEKAAHPSHPLELNTLKGHSDYVTGMAFSSDGRALATASEDGGVRVFKLEDVSAKAVKFLRMTLPPAATPRGVAFGNGAGFLLVSASDPKGGCLYMLGPASGKEAEWARRQGRLPPPEIKWEKQKAHDGKDIRTIVSAAATYGSGDGSTIAATCTEEGTDVRLWSVTDGKLLGKVDTNQLQNTMAALSPDGRFLAVAAFTADVKIWELIYSKDGSVKDVVKATQLKGHKSAITWLDFTSDSKKIVTASKDGSIKLWNLDVRYHLSEDPKSIATFPIPEPPASATVRPHVVEKIALSPDNKVLALAFGNSVQWLDMASGALLDTAEHAHEGHIRWMAWSPQPHRTESGLKNVLATCAIDKKVKLWAQPPTQT